MITHAKMTDGVTKSGERVDYEVVGAEELQNAQTIRLGTVDLISSGMAAHWFLMESFWSQAAQVLRPGGTVALWTHSSLYCHPATPNAQVVQQILSHLEDVVLGPDELASNRLSRTMYENLSMPWDLDLAQANFSRESFVRMEWNRDGRLEPGEDDFFGGGEETTLKALEEGLGTASMVTKWRDDHPGLVNTEEDCVRKTIRDIADAMGKGSQELDQIKLRTAGSTAFL